MRQLGARIPEAPRTETLRQETARQEAARTEPSPEARSPRARFEELDGEPLDADEIRSHIEGQFRQRPERAAGFEAVPRQRGVPWGLLEPEPEKAHRFPFLTLAVPAVAALLALGALLWSGSMRDRLRQQDAAMNALQAQNQKMADTLEEMSVEQKASNALSASTASPVGAYGSAAPRPVAPAMSPVAAPREKAPTELPSAKSAAPSKQPETLAATKPTEVQPEAKQEAKAESAAPKPAQELAVVKKPAPEQEIAKTPRPGENARAPELVPPYPTNYKPLGATTVPPAAAQAQASGVYRPPFPVKEAAVPPASAPRSSYAQPPVTTPRGSSALPAAATTRPAASDTTSPTYGTALAQNVDTVQGLQRHSTVPLQEFHVHEGMLTKVTPALGLSVRHPDSGRGSYSLVVSGSGSPYELRGQVNNPLVFTDNTTHREYELVVLHIADKQVYGYIRAMR